MRKPTLRSITPTVAALVAIGSLSTGIAARAAATTAPLMVEVTSPTAGTVTGTVTLTASATASAGVRSVEFFVDGRSIGSDSTSPYSLVRDTRQLPDGPRSVTARVTDTKGSSGSSPVTRLEVRNAPAGASAATSASVTTASSVTATATPTAAPTSPATDTFGTYVAPRTGIFTEASFWKQNVRSAPVDTRSGTIVADLAAQVAKVNGGNAALNVWQYTAQVVTVPADQPRVTLKFDDCQHKGYTPKGLFGVGGQFVDVPIPDSAAPSVGTDAAISIWSPSADQFWSLWKAKKLDDGWHACWGGRIDSVTTSPGYFLNGYGASASGTAGIGGMLSVRDVEYGRADHAIAFGLPDPASYKTFSWPAQRSDGSAASSSTVMEGQRFRLDPKVDVDTLPISPIAKIIAHAAQDYGMVATEKSGTVAIGVESGTMLQKATGTNPWNRYLATGAKGTDKSYNVLHNFPWDKLQALPKDYGKPTG